MKSEDVFNFYGGKTNAVSVIATLLKVTKQKIWHWGDLVPLWDAVKIEELTKGKLKVNSKDYYGINKKDLIKVTNKY